MTEINLRPLHPASAAGQTSNTQSAKADNTTGSQNTFFSFLKKIEDGCKEIYTKAKEIYTEAKEIYTEAKEIYPEAEEIYTEAKEIYIEAREIYTESQKVHSKADLVKLDDDIAKLSDDISGITGKMLSLSKEVEGFLDKLPIKSNFEQVIFKEMDTVLEKINTGAEEAKNITEYVKKFMGEGTAAAA